MDLLNALVALLRYVIIPATAYGAMLALGALGVTLIYRIPRFSNFAHGDTLAFSTAISILLTCALQKMGLAQRFLPTALLLLPLLATPALAEGWTCRLTDRCVTGESCFRLATPVTASLSFTGNSLHLSVDNETSDMTQIDATPFSRTFFQRVDGRTMAFLTLYRDGTLALSSHDAATASIGATAAIGTCTKAVG